MSNQIFKYPRTHHIEGSLAGPGDEDLNWEPFSSFQDKHLVIEEKLDGANSAISFEDHGKLLLQSRGHYLTGGPREKHFALFKTWANRFVGELWEILGTRFIMYGEWLYAKHTIFYTDLPHYFMEFDILDKKEQIFLDTNQRKEKLADAEFLSSVPVLHQGELSSHELMLNLVGPSLFIGDHQKNVLEELVAKQALDFERVWKETDQSRLMEGLYIKVEEEGKVTERYKYVRAGFMQSVFESGGHWLNRPIIANQIKEGIDIFK